MEKSILSYLDFTKKTFANKIAFQDEQTKLTFGNVDKYSRAIGTYLAKKITPESPVVVLSGRHVYTPIAFLGIVQAGGFYAPMDATMPIARLNQILKVIQAKIMIVDRANEDLATTLEFSGEILILEDMLETPIEDRLLENAIRNLNENSPLYVIFTSGSTGIPKGVITSHHSLMNYIDAVCKVLNTTEVDVLGNQSPLDYIAAIRDIYLPLKTGASMVIIPKNEFAMPTELFATLNKYKVTTLCWSVAGLELPAKLRAFESCKPEYVTKVIFSGSVMPCKYLRIWQQNLPDTLFVNQYGPTEATASCTYYVVPKLVEEDEVLPIGQAYDNYSILLLDENNEEPIIGEIGEICVKGPGLALGYYGDFERTSTSFIQNPINKNYRELIYKTGDLGSRREDGMLIFHGRKDRQIKHMGHRIELGEIEETAQKIDGITDCCALYHKEKEQLYLFYVGDATAKDITVYFRQTLPAFMVPRKLIALENIPVLPNGKTDMEKLRVYFK